MSKIEIVSNDPDVKEEAEKSYVKFTIADIRLNFSIDFNLQSIP